MDKGLKMLNFVGLVLFLGSIVTFVLISTLIEDGSLENIAFGRDVISSGTLALTLPGMWLLAVSGIWLGLRRFGARHPVFLLKAMLISAIIINAYFFIMPAVSHVTELAARSLAVGTLVSAYADAYWQESLFGALNVFLALALISIRLWVSDAKTATESVSAS